MKKRNYIRRDFLKGIRIGFGFFLGLGFSSIFAVAVTGTFNSFTSGSLIRSADINTNFTTLKTAIESIDATIPAGTIVAYGGTATPTGWLICNGSTVSRTGNAALFAAIGTNYGNGDGSTTFHLPDFRGRFLRGLDGAAGRDPNAGTRAVSNPGGNSGNAVGSLQTDSFQGHWHELQENGAGFTFGSSNGTNSGGANFAVLGTGTIIYASTIVNNGTNGPPRFSSETRPVNVYVNYIIKL